MSTAPAALNPPPAKENADVHPDRSHAQSGDPEIPARPGRARNRHARYARPRAKPRNRRWPNGCSRINGVNGVFFGSDFITVTKTDGEWQQLKPAILGAIMEHFMSGAPLLNAGERRQTMTATSSSTPADAETVATIKELIETRVRPAVANDGGDITFRGFKDGIVYLHMKGACSGCPSSTATLRHGIQNLLRHLRARRGRSPADVTGGNLAPAITAFARRDAPCVCSPSIPRWRLAPPPCSTPSTAASSQARRLPMVRGHAEALMPLIAARHGARPA